jgi:quinol monooxygenase YgiN
MKKLLITAALAISFLLPAQAKDNNMFNLLVKFTVKTEHFEEFKEACLENLKKSLKEEGNVEMKLYVDNNIPNTIYVYSRWESTEAYEIHKNMPYTTSLTKVVKYSLQSKPVIMPLKAALKVDHSKHANADDIEETLFFIFKVKDAFHNKVINQFRKHIEFTHQEVGNILFDLYTVEGDNNTFVVYENWRNKSDLWDVHMKQVYSIETGALLNEVVEGELNNYMNFVTEVK